MAQKVRMLEMIEKKQAVFLLKFFALFGLAHFLLYAVDISFLQAVLAKTEAGLLGLRSNESLVFISKQAFEITPSCTGLVSGITLGALVFSLKKPEMKKKLPIFLAGAAGLFILNFLRVYFVLLSGIWYGVGVAESVHVASWLAMTAGIIGSWYFLTKKITGIKDFDGFL